MKSLDNPAHGASSAFAAMKLNLPFPEMPEIRSLRGRGGTVVEVDPRRIKPLLGNPRMKDNPGFAEESIHGLAESIALTGQLEEGLVVPLLDDPCYDAQLVDGERRLRACIGAGVMMRVSVREDMDPFDHNMLYVCAVVRNYEKIPPTTLETAHIVTKLRQEYRLTISEVAKMLGKSPAWVSQYSSLLQLHPDVQKMLETSHDDSEETEEGIENLAEVPPRKEGKALSLHIALCLVRFPEEHQLRAAKHILTHDLGLTAARRYLLNLQRELGHNVVKLRERPGEKWAGLLSLAERSEHHFGVYLDMRQNEVEKMVHGVDINSRETLARELSFLADCLRDISLMVSPKNQRVPVKLSGKS